jgi:hypothetical protein
MLWDRNKEKLRKYICQKIPIGRHGMEKSRQSGYREFIDFKGRGLELSAAME